MTTDQLRDLLPLWVSGALDEETAAKVAAAVDASAELGEEAEFLRTVLEARPQAPDGLADRIIGALPHPGAEDQVASTGRGSVGTVAGREWGRGRSGGGMGPWWLSAAASVAVALGGTWMLVRNGGEELDVPDVLDGEVVLLAEPLTWPSDDGMVAGEATLDGLTEEQLEQLLEEMRG